MENKFSVASKTYAKVMADEYLDGHKAFWLVVSESKNEDYCKGEPWSDVSVNLFGLRPNEMALDNDFLSFSSEKLINDVLAYLTTDSTPHRFIRSGFVDFPIYELKEEFLQ